MVGLVEHEMYQRATGKLSMIDPITVWLPGPGQAFQCFKTHATSIFENEHIPLIRVLGSHRVKKNYWHSRQIRRTEQGRAELVCSKNDCSE